MGIPQANDPGRRQYIRDGFAFTIGEIVKTNIVTREAAMAKLRELAAEGPSPKAEEVLRKMEAGEM